MSEHLTPEELATLDELLALPAGDGKRDVAFCYEQADAERIAAALNREEQP